MRRCVPEAAAKSVEELSSQTVDKNNNPVLTGRYSLYLLFVEEGNIVFALGQMCVALKQYLGREMV